METGPDGVSGAVDERLAVSGRVDYGPGHFIYLPSFYMLRGGEGVDDLLRTSFSRITHNAKNLLLLRRGLAEDACPCYVVIDRSEPDRMLIRVDLLSELLDASKLACPLAVQ